MTQRAPWFLYILLFLFPFILFAPIILTGKALFWGTPLTQFIPWWKEAWELILQGEMPLWNPLLGMGAPLLANYQSALFYPPTWIYLLFYLIGGVSAMAWGQALLVIAHLAWAGIGMALLIRQLGLGTLAQIIAGLAFSLSGYLVSRAGFLSINAATAWIPWIILGITKLFDAYTSESQSNEILKTLQLTHRHQKIISAYLLLVTSLGMQLLAGHAQTAWYTLLLTLGWMVYLFLSEVWSVRRTKPEHDSGSERSLVERDLAEKSPDSKGHPSKHVTSFGVLIVLFATSLIFAIGIAAVQLLPTGEYLLQSQRSSEVSYHFAVSYSFWPWRFLTFIAPELFGSPVSGDYWGYANYWEDAVYFGFLPFVLVFSAFVTHGRRKQKTKYTRPGFLGFLLVIILIAFLLALGSNTPIFPWLYNNVPTFDMFQAPTRITILAVFSLTLLAAIGLDSWRRPGERGMYWLRLGVMAAIAITLGAVIAMIFSRSFEWGIRQSFIRATAMVGFWGVVLGVLALNTPIRVSSHPRNEKWSWWEWAVILFVAVDLVVAGWNLNPGVELSVYTNPSPTVNEVRSKIQSGRLYLPSEEEEQLKFERFLRFDSFQPFEDEEGWDSLRAAFLPNVTLLDSISSANNFDPLLPGRYVSWINALDEVEMETRDKMLNLMGVNVVESIDSEQQYGVRFDDRSAFARYRWVPCNLVVENENQALDLIQRGEVNFQKEVILERMSDLHQDECDGSSRAGIYIKSDGIHESVYQIDSSGPGYFVIADVWYPGWMAWIDGEPAPILKANYLFRALAIQAGEHEVTIAYRPLIFYVGVTLSGGFLVGLMVLFVYWLAKQREIRRT
jgi:hypothetical protein